MSYEPLGPPLAIRLAWLIVRGDRELFHAANVNAALPVDFPGEDFDWDPVRHLSEALREPEENPFRPEFFDQLARNGMGISYAGHIVPEGRALWRGDQLLGLLTRSKALEKPDRSHWLLDKTT